MVLIGSVMSGHLLDTIHAVQSVSWRYVAFPRVQDDRSSKDPRMRWGSVQHTSCRPRRQPAYGVRVTLLTLSPWHGCRTGAGVRYLSVSWRPFAAGCFSRLICRDGSCSMMMSLPRPGFTVTPRTARSTWSAWRRSTMSSRPSSLVKEPGLLATPMERPSWWESTGRTVSCCLCRRLVRLLNWAWMTGLCLRCIRRRSSVSRIRNGRLFVRWVFRCHALDHRRSFMTR
jgi:hypothetical protein